MSTGGGALVRCMYPVSTDGAKQQPTQRELARCIRYLTHADCRMERCRSVSFILSTLCTLVLAKTIQMLGATCVGQLSYTCAPHYNPTRSQNCNLFRHTLLYILDVSLEIPNVPLELQGT